MCRPGPDQTERGPQRWHLLAPLLQQKVSMGGDDRGAQTAQNLLSKRRRVSFGAFEKLARIHYPELNVGFSPPLEPSAIEALPAEITAMILSVEGLPENDILAFGSCSQTLWVQVLAHIRSEMRKTGALLAGTPLVCAGNYLQDLPAELHKAFPKVKEEQAAWQSRRYEACPARRWNQSLVFESADMSSHDAKRRWRYALAVVACNAPYIAGRSDDLERVLVGDPDKLNGEWILKNITTQEMIRLDVDIRGSDGIGATIAGAPWLSLDMALLMRICWTRLGWRTKSRFFHHQVRGRRDPVEWAGHSFEIVQGEVDDCKDVTASVIAEAKSFKIASIPPPGRVEFTEATQAALAT